MPFALTATGTVEPIETAAVGSQVGGVIVRVLFREGQEVRQGQSLFQLDPRPFRAALAEAIGDLAKDHAQALNAQRDADRALQLFNQKVLARSDWEAKDAAAKSLAGTVRADSAAVATAQLNLHYSTIRAPIAGRTGRLMVHTGDLVKAATSDPLVTINRVHPVRVSFAVPENAVSMVQHYRSRDTKVWIRASDADSVEIGGPLVFVDNAVDPSSGTLLLKGEFANRDGRLLPGEFVSVRLVLYVDPRAVVIPAPAVTNGQQGAYVYLLNPDSTVSTRMVSVARTIDDWAVVSHGLKPGEVVITDGQLRLAPGSKVIVRSPAQAQP